MELIYIYIKNFEGRIKDLQYNFSSNYNVEYCGSSYKLKREEKEENRPYNFFGENIKNITAIVGKNGAGKTSFVDILGMKYNFRYEDKDRYSMLYHVKDKIFYLETFESNLINRDCNDIKDKFMENFRGVYLKLKDDELIEIDGVEVDSIKQIIRRSCLIKTPSQNRIITPYNNGAILDRNIMQYGWEYRYKFLVNIKNNDNIDGAFRNIKSITINIKEKYSVPNHMENLMKLQFERIEKTKFTDKQFFIIHLIEQQIKRLYLELIDSNSRAGIEINKEELLKKLYKQILDMPNYEFTLFNLKKIYKETLNDINSKFRKGLNEDDNLKYLINIIDNLNGIDDKYFNNETLNITLNRVEDEYIIKFLKSLDECSLRGYSDIKNILNININNLSNGEKEFIDTFVGIQSSIGNYENIIIALDEPDRIFHPEWSRRYITYLRDNLELFDTNKIKRKYQIILTTHSPFIVSDLPKENILTMEDCKRKNIDLGNTFGTNIHTLLSNQFFMKSTIGELARQKINECIVELNKKIKDSTYEIDCEKKNEIKYIIKNIGEHIIKNKLSNMYKEAFPANEDDYRYKIKRLEEEKYKLENLLKDKKLDNIDQVMELLKRQINELKKKCGEDK